MTCDTGAFCTSCECPDPTDHPIGTGPGAYYYGKIGMEIPIESIGDLGAKLSAEAEALAAEAEAQKAEETNNNTKDGPKGIDDDAWTASMPDHILG